MSAPPGHGPPRRHLPTLLLFLALGAALNLLITWLLCITLLNAAAPRAAVSHTTVDLKPGDWTYSLLHDRRLPDQLIRNDTWAYTMHTGIWDRRLPDPHSSDFAIAFVNTGLPLRSMRYHFEIDMNPGVPRSSVIRGGWQLRTSFLAATFPLIPIWPGFLFNASIYALLSWSLLRAPRHLRRTIRKRNNCCLACGYSRTDLVPTSACPECGRIPAPNL